MLIQNKNWKTKMKNEFYKKFVTFNALIRLICRAFIFRMKKKTFSDYEQFISWKIHSNNMLHKISKCSEAFRKFINCISFAFFVRFFLESFWMETFFLIFKNGFYLLSNEKLEIFWKKRYFIEKIWLNIFDE